MISMEASLMLVKMPGEDAGCVGTQIIAFPDMLVHFER